jgi:hypothetical protein
MPQAPGRSDPSSAHAHKKIARRKPGEFAFRGVKA